MSKFSNKQHITEITMTKRIRNFCPLGNDWYTNELTIYLHPDDLIPDYVEVDKQIEELEGKEMIIEDVVDAVCKIFVDNYNPRFIEVTSNVSDATHLPVEVTKQYGNDFKN